MLGAHPQGLLLAQEQFWMSGLCICSIPEITGCSWVPPEWPSRPQCVYSKAYQLWISLSIGNQVLCTAFLLTGILHWDAMPTLWICINYSLDRWDLCLSRVELNCSGLKCSLNKYKGTDTMLWWSLTGVASVLSQLGVSTCSGPHNHFTSNNAV